MQNGSKRKMDDPLGLRFNPKSDRWNLYEVRRWTIRQILRVDNDAVTPWPDVTGVQPCTGGLTQPKFDQCRRQDLKLRPSGYEPDELTDCSTPR